MFDDCLQMVCLSQQYSQKSAAQSDLGHRNLRWSREEMSSLNLMFLDVNAGVANSNLR